MQELVEKIYNIKDFVPPSQKTKEQIQKDGYFCSDPNPVKKSPRS